MSESLSIPPAQEQTRDAEAQEMYTRFDVTQRIEHIIFLVSFTILGITGLIQKFPDSPISLAILQTLGGIETTRLIHRTSAFVMMWVSVYHVVAVLYRIIVLRQPWTMLPDINDARHVYDDVMYFLGRRKHRAYYSRYSYAEKAEYLALVWGTVVMALTGFMMWNPITTARFLPGEAIVASKAAHGAEAILAILAIILWHMWHVHIKRFNKSMFTGTMTREEMEEEHPAELAMIETGKGWQPPEPEVMRKRQIAFVPAAVILALLLSWGVIEFVTVEPLSAITTVPQGENVAVFVPVTPTPRPTAVPTPTAALGAGVSAESWDGKYSGLFANRCGTCHVRTAVGGLSLATYENALKGGTQGPGIVPGNPDASVIVQVQSPGNHPGQLSIDELEQLIGWIEAGAPEK